MAAVPAYLPLTAMAAETSQTSITHVLGDDWAGVYVNGELFCEGHSVSHWDWLALLEKLGFSAGQVEADTAWLEDNGRLPAKLTDVQTV